MEEFFTRRWLAGIVAAWLVLFALDETAYYVWKQVTPGWMYSGILVKHPLTSGKGDPTSDAANGYRPGGSINVAG
jgi:hypothetical protein